MVTDHFEHLFFYELLKQDDLILITSFIEKCKAEKMPEGTYLLRGNKLFALVQSYQTKSSEAVLLESHQKYADLQVVLEGSELVLWSQLKNLEVYEDQLVTKDVIKYFNTNNQGSFRLDRNMFAYFAPWDAHAPSISCRNDLPGLVKKVVFKIEVKTSPKE